MRLIKFLSVLEKIIIALIILCFIPIAIFAISLKPIITSSSLETAFLRTKAQASYSGFLTSMLTNITCNNVELLAYMNERYLQRCVVGGNCHILPSNSPCPLSQSYIINSTMFCSTKVVANQYIPADTIAFEHNASLFPLASLSLAEGQLVPEYYCIKSIKECKELLSFFGKDISQSFADNYEIFSTVVKYLMYFGLIPLIAHTIIVFVLDSLCNYNLRLTNSLMIIHQSLIGAGIIIAGITYNSNNDQMTARINKLASECLISHPQCSTISSPFSSFSPDDSVSSTFVTAMCFVLALEILLLIGVVILNILMVKYYKLRELDPTLSGYQLQTL